MAQTEPDYAADEARATQLGRTESPAEAAGIGIIRESA